MAVTLKASYKGTPGNATIAYPVAGPIASGDLLILLLSDYTGSAIPTTSGYILHKNYTNTNGTYRVSTSVQYRIANGLETGNLQTGVSESYSGIYLLVVSGHRSTSPYFESAAPTAQGTQSSGTTSAVVPQWTTTNAIKNIAFTAAMSDSTSTPPTIIQYGAGGYNNVQAYSSTTYFSSKVTIRIGNDTPTVGSTWGETSSNTSMVHQHIGIIDSVQPPPSPTLSNLYPTNYAPVSRTGSTTFIWSTAGNSGLTFDRSELRYRIKDSLGAYTTITSATRGQVPVVGTTFTDGEEYEIIGQDFYTEVDSETISGFITSGPSAWTYLSEVTSSSSSTTITGLTTAGNYSLGVRTSDAIGFGPYSTGTTFAIPVGSNVYVRVSGSWVVKPRFTRVAGVMKDTGRVKVKVGGSFV